MRVGKTQRHGKMLVEPMFGQDLVWMQREEFCMQQHATGFLPAPFVINEVQAARQQHMGRADIGIFAIPLHQWDFVERWGFLWLVLEERPRAWAALYP